MAADDDDKDEAAESSPDADGGESDDARDDEESTLASTPSARAKERERARDRRRRAQRERGDLAEAQESAGRRRNVERVMTFVAGAAVGSLVMFFVLRATNKAAAAAAAADAGAASAAPSTVTAAGGAGVDDAGELAMNEDLLAAAAAAAAGGGGGGGSGADYRATGTGPGSRMPDGSPVPALSEAAPKVVRFAVVLVSYQGAQGAPPNARSKADAQALATKLAEQAKTDFHGAVAQGDPGSADDAGRIPRGVLELFPEYTLFTLPKGGVSDAVDTPRGFWIVKRTE